MVDAAGQFLDPTLGSTVPRPTGFEPGAFPLQADAARLLAWTLGATGRAILLPFGEAVGEPMHYEYEAMTSWLAGVHCLGDPANPDDRSQVQAAMDNLPQLARVAASWWWDWRRATLTSQAWNRSLASRTANPYLGHQTRGGDDRPVLAVSSLLTNGGVSLSSLTNLVLAAPGNATRADLDCPMVSDDGSAADPLPLRVPVWIGREGHRGQAGQVLAAGSTSQHVGSHLKLRPGPLSFTDDLANLRISLNAGAEIGGEGFAQLGYTMARLDGPFTFLRPDPNPPYTACTVYQERLVRTVEQSAHIQVFATPLGDAWAGSPAPTSLVSATVAPSSPPAAGAPARLKEGSSRDRFPALARPLRRPDPGCAALALGHVAAGRHLRRQPGSRRALPRPHRPTPVGAGCPCLARRLRLPPGRRHLGGRGPPTCRRPVSRPRPRQLRPWSACGPPSQARHPTARRPHQGRRGPGPTPQALPRRQGRLALAEEPTDLPPGWRRLTFTTTGLAECQHWVLGMGATVRAEGPEPLVTWIQDQIRQLQQPLGATG